MQELFALVLITAGVAAYLIHRFRHPAVRLGLVDLPDGRKNHIGHIPLVGGAGMFIAFGFGALLADFSLAPYRPLFTGAGLLLISGILDDLHDLPPVEKLCLQLLGAGVLVFWGGLTIPTLGVLPFLGTVELGAFSIPFTLICVVGLINAVNMIDGLDGLCGGIVVAMLFWLIVAGAAAGASVALLGLPALLAASVVGFLLFNMPRRSNREPPVFMGDSGSTMLGFLIAWFAIELVFRHGLEMPPVTVAWILALPVFDTICLMIRRTLKGKNPMKSDREHLHHVFERAGFSRTATTYILIGCAFCLGALGVCGWWAGVPEAVLWPPLLLLLALYFLFVHHAWYAMRLLRHLRPPVRPALAEADAPKGSANSGHAR